MTQQQQQQQQQQILSIHSDHITEIYEVPLEVICRPLETICDEKKVLSLIETLQVSFIFV
jgi:uncharacterized ParB-like nuclease family protein